MSYDDGGPDPYQGISFLILAASLACYFVFSLFRRSLEEFFPHKIFRILGKDEESEESPLPPWLRDSYRLRFGFRWLSYLSSTVFLVALPVVFRLRSSSEEARFAVLVGIGFALLFLTGHLIPKFIMASLSDQSCLVLLRMMAVVHWVSTPVSGLLYRLGTIGERNINQLRDDEVPEPEDEVRAYIQASAEAGVIEVEENRIIQRVMDLGDTVVREVMTPRTDIIGVDEDATAAEIRELLSQNRKSRIPVFRESVDTIVGVLYLKDLIRVWAEGRTDIDLKALYRTPYFIPETKKISELLQEFQVRKLHIAIVVDEYGGTSGLVTIEDLLEEIVGEIDDEYDLAPEVLINRLEQNRGFLVNAKTLVDDLAHELDIDIPHEDFDSVGGFVLHRFERMPREGDSFTYRGYTFTVERADARRVIQVLVQPEGLDQQQGALSDSTSPTEAELPQEA